MVSFLPMLIQISGRIQHSDLSVGLCFQNGTLFCPENVHLVLNPEMGSLKSGAYESSSGNSGSVNVTVPLFLDGKQITSATSSIQTQRNVSYRRSLGVI